MAPSARFCDMDGWKLDWQSAHFMQYSHMIFSTSTYWQVCRVTRRCHAFGVAIRTTQRCLGHYRRLWTRQGWIWCRVHQQGKKSDHFFFGGRHSSRKIKIEQKYIEHFFLYFWGLQVYLHITYDTFIIDTYCVSITTAASEFIIPEWFPIFDPTASRRLAQMATTEELRGSNNLVDFLSSALVFWIIRGSLVLIFCWIHSLTGPGCISGKMELMNSQVFCLWDSDQVKSSRRQE